MNSRWIAAALAGALMLTPLAAGAQAVDQAQADAGMELFKPTGANCEMCHAWTGGGRWNDTPFSTVPATGPSLITSSMTRAQMIEVIGCGSVRGDAVMPRYRGDAWTPQFPCYGKVGTGATADERPVPGERQLTAAQIEAMVTYIQAVYQGKTMTLANCEKYFGPKSKGCDLLRK